MLKKIFKFILDYFYFLVALLIIPTFFGFQFFSNLNENFFKIDIANYFTTICAFIELLLIIYISYYLTEKKNDERVIKEKLNNELEFISLTINKLNKDFFNENFKIEDYTLLKKKIDRSIKIVDHYKKQFNYSDESKRIKDEFESIDYAISHHIHSSEEIRNIIDDLRLHKDRIDNEYSNIFLKLFK